MTRVVDLGAFAPDLEVVVKQLRQDMKDDWYPDPLGFEDVLRPEVVAGLLESSFHSNHGLIIPSDRAELNIPKKGFVLRYALEMSLPDRLYFQSLVGALIPLFDPLLPNNVLNHRYSAERVRDGRYLFKNAIDQWKRFRGYVAQDLKTRPVLVITDVQNFFENIGVNEVIRVLTDSVPRLSCSAGEKAMVRRVIAELERCLRRWCYSQSHGLPQNRDASSFLASLVMLRVDKFMLERGYSYYRYMDDIRIAAGDRFEARAALQDLSTELRRSGLSLNAGKTRILEPKDDGYPEAVGQDDAVLSQIDSMWRSRAVPVIRRSIVPLRSLALNLIATGETGERAFRFCVSRYEKLALCAELGVAKAFFDPMTAACVDHLENHPYSSDQLVRFLKAAPTDANQLAPVASLLLDGRRAVYDWQNYLLWQLLTFKGHVTAELLDAARLRYQETSRPGDRAGAVHYLGALGGDADRVAIAASFGTFRHFIEQRNALIAIHDLDYGSGVKQNVKGKVMPSLEGTYRRLHREFRGVYSKPPETVPASSLYNEGSSYV